MPSAIVRRPLLTVAHRAAGANIAALTSAVIECEHLHLGMQRVVFALNIGCIPVDRHQVFDSPPPIFTVPADVPHTGGQIGGIAFPTV